MFLDNSLKKERIFCSYDIAYIFDFLSPLILGINSYDKNILFYISSNKHEYNDKCSLFKDKNENKISF